jgi:putative colanic acid biosynthesis UDP-glucose lipid carrier transferase
MANIDGISSRQYLGGARDQYREGYKANLGPFGRSTPARPAYSRLKRALDIVASLLALLLFLPIFAVAAFLVRATSPGPIIFRQHRTGLGGQPFELLKFRTMHVTEDGEQIRHAMRGDRRVTRIGAILRATSVDELPQLINVLRGDMSLVGPRPHALAHDRHYGALIHGYAKRFMVKPGMTGLAQIRGLRGEIHELYSMERRVRADREYIASWSLACDLRIILLTLPRMLGDSHAY